MDNPHITGQQEEERDEDQTKTKHKENKNNIWRKPWWKARTRVKGVNDTHLSHHTDTALDLQTSSTLPDDLAGQPGKLSSRHGKTSLTSAAVFAYSTGTVVASMAAAAVLSLMPPSTEPVRFGKTPSTARTPKSESRLKTLEDEAVVAALAAAAATAAAAAERARITAQAAIAVQAQQNRANGNDETCGAIQSDPDEKSLNGASSKTPRQSEVLHTPSKKRRMPKSRPPRPSVAFPRLSGVTPRVSGPRSTTEDFGISYAPLGSLMGATKATPPPAMSPRLAARLADLVSSAVPNKVPSVGGSTQLKTPMIKGGRGSVSRTTRGVANHRPPTPSGVSNATEPARGHSPRLAPATHLKPSVRYGTLPAHGQPSGSNPQTSGTHPQPLVSHLQTPTSHPQPYAPHSLAAALYDTQPQLAFPRSLQPAVHPHRLASQSQETTSHQPHAVQFQQRTTTTTQSNTSSLHPTGRALAASSCRPSVTLATHALASSVAASHAVHSSATPTSQRFAAPLGANNNSSSEHTYASSLNHPYESLVPTTPAIQPRPSGATEANRAHVSSPLVPQSQFAHSTLAQPPPRPLHSYGTLPPRLPSSATGSSSAPLVYAPMPLLSEPHVTIAMVPNIASHQWLQKHNEETPLKTHRAAAGHRPSSATQSSLGLRGRGLNRTSISAAALDLPKLPESRVTWTGGKIAPPADDPSFTENMPPSAEATDNGYPTWIYHYQSVPLAQQPAVQWPGTWTDANVTAAPPMDKDIKPDPEPQIHDSFNLGVDVLSPISKEAWDLDRSGSTGSLPQSYVPTEPSPTRQTNDVENLWPEETVSCERKSTNVLWNKNAPMGASLPLQANVKYQTAWPPSLGTQNSVQWAQSTPSAFNDRSGSSSETVGGPVQSLDNALKVGYHNAIYQQNFLETFEAVCLQQQLASRQSQQSQQPLQPLRSQLSLQVQLQSQQPLQPQESQQSLQSQFQSLQPHLQSQHPLQSQQSLQPQFQSLQPQLQSQHPIQPHQLLQPQSLQLLQFQQPQQQHFPETVLEEEP